MNVLGLFNGMGGGNIALTELGIKHNYFSSEVDKFANKQVAHNFPDTVHLGSVLDVSGYDLPRMDLIWQLGHGFNDGGLKALDGKVPTLTKNSWEQNNFLIQNYRIRRLTPTEAAKLQTVPAWYRWIVSDTQIYKMCGNGWTIEVIKHILSFIKL